MCPADSLFYWRRWSETIGFTEEKLLNLIIRIAKGFQKHSSLISTCQVRLKSYRILLPHNFLPRNHLLHSLRNVRILHLLLDMKIHCKTLKGKLVRFFVMYNISLKFSLIFIGSAIIQVISFKKNIREMSLNLTTTSVDGVRVHLFFNDLCKYGCAYLHAINYIRLITNRKMWAMSSALFARYWFHFLERLY